jgi:hypothetical protein
MEELSEAKKHTEQAAILEQKRIENLTKQQRENEVLRKKVSELEQRDVEKERTILKMQALQELVDRELDPDAIFICLGKTKEETFKRIDAFEKLSIKNAEKNTAKIMNTASRTPHLSLIQGSDKEETKPMDPDEFVDKFLRGEIR